MDNLIIVFKKKKIKREREKRDNVKKDIRTETAKRPISRIACMECTVVLQNYDFVHECKNKP